MSNPGVVYLAEKKLPNGDSFRIEDNIGEAIHVHYGEIRLDLTISEFLKIANALNPLLNSLIQVENFSFECFDPYFLEEIAPYLKDLKKIEYTTILLEDIQVQTEGIFGLPVMRSLKYSRVIKALNGNSKENDKYTQENFPGETNHTRIVKMNDSIKKYGYPYKKQYMIFFNQQNAIRDGQHRASCLYKQFGNIEVPIIRLHFNNNLYNVSEYPIIDKIFVWNKNRFKSLFRRIKQKVNGYLKRIKWKYVYIKFGMK